MQPTARVEYASRGVQTDEMTPYPRMQQTMEEELMKVENYSTESHRDSGLEVTEPSRQGSTHAEATYRDEPTHEDSDSGSDLLSFEELPPPDFCKVSHDWW